MSSRSTQNRVRRQKAQKRMQELLESKNQQAIASFVEAHHARYQELVRKLLTRARHITPTVIQRAANTNTQYLDDLAANQHISPEQNQQLERHAQKLLEGTSRQLVQLGRQITLTLDKKGYQLSEQTLQAFAAPVGQSVTKPTPQTLDRLLQIQVMPEELFRRLVKKVIENREARQVKQLVDHPMTAERPEVLKQINQNFSWPSVRERLARLNRKSPLPEAVRKTLFTSRSWKVLAPLRWRASSAEFAHIFRQVMPRDSEAHQKDKRLQKVYSMLRQAQDYQLQDLTAGDVAPLLKHPHQEVRQFAMRVAGRLPGNVKPSQGRPRQ